MKAKTVRISLRKLPVNIEDTISFEKESNILKHKAMKRRTIKKRDKQSTLPLPQPFDMDVFLSFDQSSAVAILFDSLHPLMKSEKAFEQTSLLVRAFLPWCYSLPVCSAITVDLYHFLAVNRWENYLVLVIFCFVKNHYKQMDLILYQKCRERLADYVQENSLSTVPYSTLHQFLNFISLFSDICLTNTEFVLLNTILMLRLDSEKVDYLETVPFQMLYVYEQTFFLWKEPHRLEHLLNFADQLHSLTETLVDQEQLYVPFLLFST